MVLLNIFETSYEKNFNSYNVTDYVKNNYNILLLSILLYLIFCHYGKKIMDTKQAFDLKYPLAIWNAFYHYSHY
jgi:elongation of very long chain fatty acids protein 6